VAGVEVLRDFRFTIERQTTWGTVVDSAPIGLPTDEMFVKLDSGNHVIPMATGTPWDVEAHSFNDSSIMIPKVTFKVPATPQLLTLFMPAILQKSADYTAASDVWTYIPQLVASRPLMRGSNQGYFYTLTARSANANKSIRMHDAVCTSLKRMIHPTNDDKVCYLELEFIGRGYTIAANPSGTVTDASLATLYKWIDLDAFTINGSAMITDFVSLETTISYGAKFRNDVPTGEIVFPKLETSGQFVVASNSNTDTLKGLCKTNAVSNAIPMLLQWGDGTVGSAGEWNTEEYIQLLDHESDRAEGENITFQFRGNGGGSGEYPFKSVHHYVAA
jgi:hypothetical protein